MKTVCFVSLHAYPVAEPSAEGIFGGTETRAVTLAEGLAASGEYQVCFLARHPRLTQPTQIAGVTWLPWRDFWVELRAHASQFIEASPRFPGAQLTGWSWHLLWELPLIAFSFPFTRRRKIAQKRVPQLQRLPADLFLTFGVNSGSATVIANAQMRKAPSILFLGSNSDVSESHRPDSQIKNMYGERGETCYWALQHATAIIAQNEYQQQMLKQRFGREAVLIPNPLDTETWQAAVNQARFEPPPDELKALTDAHREQGYVLWIGRAETYHKRAQLAIELARACPALPFVLVLNPRDRRIEAEIEQQCPANVTLIRQLPFAAMPALFAGARVYLNTSSAEYEGFPNVFLQAAASGVPIVSLEVAPDFLASSGAGVCLQGDLSAVPAALNTTLQTFDETAPQRQQAARWITQHYSLTTAIALLRSQLQALLT